MPKHANYAAVLSIKQQVIQDHLNLSYCDGDIPHVLTAPAILGLSADFFIDNPKIILDSSRPNCLVIEGTAWGDLTITPTGSVSETRRVVTSIKAVLPFAQTIQEAVLSFELDDENATIESLSVSPFGGEEPFSETAQAIIDGVSPIAGPIFFKDAITIAIREYLFSLKDTFPTYDISKIFPWVHDGLVVTRIFGDTLVAGIDIQYGAKTTSGNIEQLSDISGGQDIAICINKEVWLPNLKSIARAKLKDLIRKVLKNIPAYTGAHISSFNITVHEGFFFFHGKVSGVGGSVTFSIVAVPRLSVPPEGKESKEEIWLEIIHKSIDIQRDWWVVVGEVIGGFVTFGWAAVIFEQIVSSIRNLAYSTFAVFSGQMRFPMDNEFTNTSSSQGKTNLSIRRFSCHPWGMFVSIYYSIKLPSYKLLAGSRYIQIDEIRDKPLQLQMPFRAYLSDPCLRIRWVVRGFESAEVFRELDQGISEAHSFTLSKDIILQSVSENSTLNVECYLYRVFGSATEPIYSSSVRVKIVDRLDRSHPYVRWGHYVLVPCVRVETDGSKTFMGSTIKFRRSCLHKTAYPGRCRTVAKYSTNMPWKAGALQRVNKEKVFIEYLDELPAATSEGQVRGNKLCEYCFSHGSGNSRHE